MKTIMFISMLLVSAGIPFLNEAQLKKQLSKNTITVIEFYAKWNDQNAVNDISKLKDCDVFRIDIDQEPMLQSEYNVVVVPTIIIFKNGEEIKRYQANLMFKMCPKSFSCENIQNKINNDKMLKFR